MRHVVMAMVLVVRMVIRRTRGVCCRARFQFLGGQHPGIDAPFDARVQPFFVITRGQVVDRIHLLDVMPGAPWNRHRRRPLHGEYAPFPGMVEHRFVLLPLDGAKAVHAPHIVNAVHARSPVRLCHSCAGCFPPGYAYERALSIVPTPPMAS